MEKNPAKPDGLNPEYMRLVAETAHTLGPWFIGSTPKYLGMHQWADGKARKINPLTIRSPHHTEEIATVWNYLLPTEANARLIAAAPETKVQRDELLAALKVVEWISDQHGFVFCPCCRESAQYDSGVLLDHAQDCQLKLALAKAETTDRASPGPLPKLP